MTTQFNIPVSEEDRKVLAAAINELCKLQHLKYMTYDMLAKETHWKPSKIRNVLQALLDDKEVTQYDVPGVGKLTRYCYFLTETGKMLIAPPSEEV